MFKRAVVCSLVALAAALSTGAQARTELDASTLQQLQQLERRYFGHNFDSDSDENRAQRLEKLIYGDGFAGDLPNRIKLMASEATAASQSATKSANQNDTAAKSNGSGGDYGSAPGNAVSNDAQADGETAPDSNDAGKDHYPRITALENAILGENFVGQPLASRLARMESKTFGTASSDSDLSQRTDALELYAEQKLHKKLFQADTSYESVGRDGEQSESHQDGSHQAEIHQSAYPRITALEQAILGKAFSEKPLPERLSQMESSAFGKPSESADLSQRTEALERYAEKKLHKKPVQQAGGNQSAHQATTQGSALPKQLAAMIGNSLLGMAGLPVGIGPGFGPGGYGGAGGARKPGNQTERPQQSDSPTAPRLEDPFVHAPTPPPASARILTKVGWCEMQLFGQTYPNLHLSDRLGQLNRKLNFKPGKPDVTLMDDISALVTAVEAKMQSVKSIGVTPQATTPD